ncbi:MAG: hypothetical protein B6229_08955 [Spirochaetaceae bacterium 4572_7]|nr:MAG: hypothetical protein B6229_08955 [Spirochaetaceae bacterium 4572_7]
MRRVITTLLFLLSTNLFSTDNFIDGVFIHPVSRYFDMDIDANNSKHPMEESFDLGITGKKIILCIKILYMS